MEAVIQSAAPGSGVTQSDHQHSVGSGKINAITILQSSGIAELDEAPKKAFWEISAFPNPPTQMFGKDGFEDAVARIADIERSQGA